MVIPLFAIKIAMWTLFRTKTNAVSEAKLIAGVDAESKGEVGRWTGVGGGGVGIMRVSFSWIYIATKKI